jgi:hypothetical protein
VAINVRLARRGVHVISKPHGVSVTAQPGTQQSAPSDKPTLKPTAISKSTAFNSVVLASQTPVVPKRARLWEQRIAIRRSILVSHSFWVLYFST